MRQRPDTGNQNSESMRRQTLLAQSQGRVALFQEA
jgi:hypothetical protein